MGVGVARGIAMGAADVVPGVSGGTVAIVLGIYERLLAAIQLMTTAVMALIRGRLRDSRLRLAEVDWWFLLPLFGGIVVTVLSGASVIETQLEERPEVMAGLFCGLVGASGVLSCRLFDWSRPHRIAVMTLSTALTFAFLGFQSAPVVNPSPLVLFGAAAVAVCAMILPGVSGSFLLLMLGMYGAVIQIITDTRYLDGTVFILGAALGLGLFSTLLSKLLKRARDTVMAVMVGLMFGSLRVLWPWPHGVGVISREHDQVVSGIGLDWPAASEWFAPTVAAAVGVVVVVWLRHIVQNGMAIQPVSTPKP